MPDLKFQITDIEPAVCGLVPLLRFNVEIRNRPETEAIHSIMLHAQVQIQSPQRSYNADEKERLSELFGQPDRWGQTLRNRLWGHSETTVRGFTCSTEATLPMPCTFDLNVAATKYFHALDGGDVPLLFLFSGTVFYEAEDGRLQVQQIPWDNESSYRMPVEIWQKMMDRHFPNTAWLYLQRDVFDKLYAYKRSQGCASWEQTIACLLDTKRQPAVLA